MRGSILRRGRSRTHHQAVREVVHGALVCVVLVRVLDDERIDDGREPVDEPVEVHARPRLARTWCPVVLGQSEEVVQLRHDRRVHPGERTAERARDRLGGVHTDGAATLRGSTRSD